MATAKAAKEGSFTLDNGKKPTVTSLSAYLGRSPKWVCEAVYGVSGVWPDKGKHSIDRSVVKDVFLINDDTRRPPARGERRPASLRRMTRSAPSLRRRWRTS